MKVIARICFPDESDDHMKVLRRLLDFYIKVEGISGETIVDVVLEDDDVVIDVGKGFHCLFIPIKKLKEILTDKEH